MAESQINMCLFKTLNRHAPYSTIWRPDAASQAGPHLSGLAIVGCVPTCVGLFSGTQSIAHVRQLSLQTQSMLYSSGRSLYKEAWTQRWPPRSHACRRGLEVYRGPGTDNQLHQYLKQNEVQSARAESTHKYVPLVEFVYLVFTFKRVYLLRSLCTLYLHASKVRVTVGDSVPFVVVLVLRISSAN